MMRVVTAPAKNIPTKRAAILSDEKMSIYRIVHVAVDTISFDISPASGEYVDDCTTVTDGDIECSITVGDGSIEVVLPLVYYVEETHPKIVVI